MLSLQKSSLYRYYMQLLSWTTIIIGSNINELKNKVKFLIFINLLNDSKLALD